MTLDPPAIIPDLFHGFVFTGTGRIALRRVAALPEEPGSQTTTLTEEVQTTTNPAQHSAGEVDETPLMTPESFNLHLRRLLPARGLRFKDDHHDTCMVIERSKNLNVVAYTANLIDAENGSNGGGKAQSTTEVTGEGIRAAINAHHPLRVYWIKIEPEHVARRRARGEMTDICELSMVERKMAYGCQIAPIAVGKFVSEVASSADKKGKKYQQSGDGESGKASAAVSWSEEHEDMVRNWHIYFQPCVGKYVAAPQWPVLMVLLPPLCSTNDANTDPATISDHPPTDGDAAHFTDPETQRQLSFSLLDTIPVMLTSIAGKVSILSKVFVSSIEPKHFCQLPSVEYIEAYGISLESGEQTYERK